jgi:predicted helicase
MGPRQRPQWPLRAAQYLKPPALPGDTKHNVFGIQTGVTISFMVKRAKTKGCQIHYARRPQLDTADEKLAFLGSAKFDAIVFEDVRPNARHDWINQTVNDFESLVPVADKATKSVKVAGQERAIFKLFSLGVVTARDEWMVDFDANQLRRKVEWFCEKYESEKSRWEVAGRPEDVSEFVDRSIKWTEELEAHLIRGTSFTYSKKSVVNELYRPFVSPLLHYAEGLTHRRYQMPSVFPRAAKNQVISFLSIISSWPLAALATDRVFDYCLLKQGNGATQSVARWQYESSGRRVDNITDWAFEQFHAHYEKGIKAKRPITKDAIFHYVYAVLHDPIYREKYAQNLKRDFPRIPFYADFWRWAEWGETLMALHIGYERVAPWPLTRIDVPDRKSSKAGLPPKTLLRANKDTGNIQLDSETQLTGVPKEAWTYKLGNRTALEWILDQYKKKTPKDPTIREKFNTYRFADHKEKVIDLLKRVTSVSVETMQIVEAMRAEKR